MHAHFAFLWLKIHLGCAVRPSFWKASSTALLGVLEANVNGDENALPAGVGSILSTSIADDEL